MKFKLLSIFPNILDSYLNDSMIKRALDKKIISLDKFNLRDWTHDRHHSVDDTPYGGGAGMLMKIEPLYQALKDINKKSKVEAKKERLYYFQLVVKLGIKRWRDNIASLKKLFLSVGVMKGWMPE